MIQYYGTLFDMGFFLFQIHIIKLFNIAFEDRLEKLFKKKLRNSLLAIKIINNTNMKLI